ncbi:MAG: TIGR04552 family protein [Firmicutes bacterium]|nr:TIGR04552 family protein [Bacillota bacterium]
MLNHALFPLPTEVTRVILGGASFIDQRRMNLPAVEQAREFALGYGYDPDVPHHRDHLVQVFEDALAFVEEVILEGSGVDIPSEFFELQNPLDLLTWASQRPQDDRARWSCALLRVMHTLFHVDNNVYLRFMPDIQQQIFDRYERFLVPLEGGRWALRGRYEVPLLAIKRKESKDRVSMLLKLLHKPDNVAETIYDQIGLRFVAEDLLGVLMVLRFLLDHHIVMAAHLKSTRTRNLMVDLEALEEWSSELPEGFCLSDLSPEERKRVSERLTLVSGRPEVNPFSSSSYSAVQFTARSLIRLPNPAESVLKNVQKRLNRMGKGDLSDLLRIPELIQEQEEFTFFFAHEVQVMERSGFESAVSGPSSHTQYKHRQREAVKKRILQGITQEAPC